MESLADLYVLVGNLLALGEDADVIRAVVEDALNDDDDDGEAV